MAHFQNNSDINKCDVVMHIDVRDSMSHYAINHNKQCVWCDTEFSNLDLHILIV